MTVNEDASPAAGLANVQRVEISVDARALGIFGWYHVAMDTISEMLAGILETVPRCRDLVIEFRNVPAGEQVRAVRIGVEMRRLDRLMVSWKEEHGVGVSYELDRKMWR